MNKYKPCARCGSRVKIKPYVFAEDGFVHTVYACMCCASETSLDDKMSEYYKILKEREQSEQKIPTKTADNRR